MISLPRAFCKLPELLDKRKMEKPVKYDDYVLLTFS